MFNANYSDYKHTLIDASITIYFKLKRMQSSVPERPGRRRVWYFTNYLTAKESSRTIHICNVTYHAIMIKRQSYHNIYKVISSLTLRNRDQHLFDRQQQSWWIIKTFECRNRIRFTNRAIKDQWIYMKIKMYW